MILTNSGCAEHAEASPKGGIAVFLGVIRMTPFTVGWFYRAFLGGLPEKAFLFLRRFTMRMFMMALASLVVFGFLASVAAANPAMLPKHPGYPGAKAVSPVTGQELSNDPGETNASGERALQAAAAAEDAHVVQHLKNPEEERILEKPGAGLLPKVQGPQIKIEPPVKEATRMK